jgi:hypothetical protein
MKDLEIFDTHLEINIQKSKIFRKVKLIFIEGVIKWL